MDRWDSPNFFGTDPWRTVFQKYACPAAVLAVGLVADLLQHTHAARNAALPLLLVSIAELLSVLALGTFVVE